MKDIFLLITFLKFVKILHYIKLFRSVFKKINFHEIKQRLDDDLLLCTIFT